MVWRIEIKDEFRSSSAKLHDITGLKFAGSFDSAFVDEGAVTAFEIENREFRLAGSCNFDLHVTPAYQIVSREVVTNVARRRVTGY